MWWLGERMSLYVYLLWVYGYFWIVVRQWHRQAIRSLNFFKFRLLTGKKREQHVRRKIWVHFIVPLNLPIHISAPSNMYVYISKRFYFQLGDFMVVHSKSFFNMGIFSFNSIGEIDYWKKSQSSVQILHFSTLEVRHAVAI